MNARSASRAEALAQAAGGRKVLVWDAPVRIFHWLMVASFAGGLGQRLSAGCGSCVH